MTDRGYTGHLHNDEVGLIYMNARFYVPAVGRFASADTIVPNPTNPQAFNRYSYVKNNPLNRTDPTGHVDCSLLGDESDIQGCQNPTLPSLPSSPPNGLTDRPVGHPSGPGGLQAYQALAEIQNQEGAWWGDELSADEAVMMFLNHEGGHTMFKMLDGSWYFLPELLEAITHKYNQFCSGGTWTASCFNGFWAYSHPLTNVVSPIEHIRKAAIKNIRTNARYFYSGQREGMNQLAKQVMNNPSIGGQLDNRPSDWVNYAKPDVIKTIWSNIKTYGTGNNPLQMVFYAFPMPVGDSDPNPTSLFVIYTYSQYD